MALFFEGTLSYTAHAVETQAVRANIRFRCHPDGIEEGRGQSIQASSPKQYHQNVISGIFPSSTHRVYRLEIATFNHVDIFDPAVVCTLPCCPSPLLSGYHSTPFPVSKYSILYTDRLWLRGGWGGGGVELCWRPYSAGVLHSVPDQIQNIQLDYPGGGC